MDRWKIEFLRMIRDGVQPDIAARRSSGLSLADVMAYHDADPEFGRLWDMASPDDTGEAVVSARILSPSSLEALLWAQTPDDEVAGYFGLTVDELQARVALDPVLQRVYDTARLGGKAAIRKAQFKSVVDGNVSAQQWVGKQYLGQADKVETVTTVQHAVSLEDVARRLAMITHKTGVDILPAIEAEVVDSE